MALLTWLVLVILFDLGYYYLRGGVGWDFVAGFIGGKLLGVSMVLAYSWAMGPRGRLWPQWRRQRGPRAVR